MLQTQEKIILASASAIRGKMLSDLNIQFSTENSGVDEDIVKKRMTGKPFPELAIELAKEKAKAVSEKNPDAWVLGADQICHDDQTLYDKSENREKAIAQLIQLRGKKHWLISAAALFKNGKEIWSGSEAAELTMRNPDQEFIEKFIDFEKSYDSCGSYRYETYGKILFQKVTGSFECILGLPLHQILGVLFEKQILTV